MSEAFPPTDHEFLDKLMRDSSMVYPKILTDHFARRAIESVDELIRKKIIDPLDRESYIDLNQEFITPERHFQGRLINTLNEQTLAYLGSDVAKHKLIPVGILNIPELNAFAIRTPRGGAAIAIYVGLWAFLKVAFYSLIAIIYRKSGNPIGDHHTNDTYAINLYSTVNAIKSGSIMIMLKDGDHSIADCVGDSAKPEPFVAQLMEFALTFTLLHEYGHVYHGHLDESLTRRVSFGGEDIDIYLKSHEQEYEADEFAATKLFSNGKDALLDNVHRVLAITMLLLLLDLCEGDNSPEILGTHPKSKQRLKRIYTVYENLYGNSTWKKMKEATDYVEMVFKILNDHKPRL